MNKNKPNKTCVKAELLPEQKEQLRQKAEKMKYSLSEYIRLRIMDETEGKEEMIRKASRHIPRCYHFIEQVKDDAIRVALKEEMCQLWQCLK